MLGIRIFQIAFNIPNARLSEFLKLFLICQIPPPQNMWSRGCQFKTFLCVLFCLVVSWGFIGGII